MKTPQWQKKLGGNAGEHYVVAELSKRAILNALLPENLSDDDIIISKKNGTTAGFIQVKACHPDRSKSFLLREQHEAWQNAPPNQFVTLVHLGSPKNNEPPRYWITTKRELGAYLTTLPSHGKSNQERRLCIDHPKLPSVKPAWENNWTLLSDFLP